MTHTSQRLTSKQHYWLAHLQAIASSSQSIVDYANSHQLSAQSLYRWKNRLKSKGKFDLSEMSNQSTISTQAHWIHASIAADAATKEQAICRCTLKNGTELMINQNIDTQQLNLVMQFMVAAS